MEDLARHPYGNLTRERRRGLTRHLLEEAANAPDHERSTLLDEVILINVCVARSIASRYARRGVALEDLEQVANAALVRVVHNFEPGPDRDLLSYAVPSIRGELRRYFRDQGWVVRPPRRIQEIQARVIEARERLAAQPEAVSTAMIAEAVDATEEEVEEALAAEGCFSPTSLDGVVGPEGTSALGDLLPEESTDQDEAAAEARVMLQPVVRGLPERDRRLLRMRFFEDLTQQEIADRCGVTQTQVSRLLSRILGELRRGLGEGAAGAPTPPPAKEATTETPVEGAGT